MTLVWIIRSSNGTGGMNYETNSCSNLNESQLRMLRVFLERKVNDSNSSIDFHIIGN